MNCKNCGNQIVPGTKSCPFCGTPIESNDQEEIEMFDIDEEIPAHKEFNQVNTGEEQGETEAVEETEEVDDEEEEDSKFTPKKIIIIIVLIAILGAIGYFGISFLNGYSEVSKTIDTETEHVLKTMTTQFKNQFSNYCMTSEELGSYTYYTDSSKTTKSSLEECMSSKCYIELSGSEADKFARAIKDSTNPAYISMTINRCMIETSCIHYESGQFAGIKTELQSTGNVVVEKGKCK